MDRCTKEKGAWQDRKGSRSGHPRNDRKRPAGFKGTNRHDIETDLTFASTSAAKILKKSPEFEVRIDQTFSYVILEFFLVFGALQGLLKCKKCDSDVKFFKKSIRGLGFKICVQCSCQDPAEIDSCPLIKNAYEINRRFCFAMRLLGIGINGIRNFVALMDLTANFNNNTYYGIVKILQIAVKSIYEAVVKKAGTEEKEKTLEAENRGDILTVSGDGSWSKRGFTSRMGIVSVIGKYTNKVLDVAVKSSFCKACELWKGQEGTPEYEAWFVTHESECNVNHEGSAGKMEVDGIIEIFKRSEELHNAKYGFYIGDGDTKTFKMLLEAKPYGDDLTVKKKECVLHVKKRVYKRGNEARKRLIQLKKATKQIEDKAVESEPKKKDLVRVLRKLKKIKQKNLLLNRKERN